ncbi:hypothetical protein HZA73_03780 [candidate division TA06 bacterium]|nr:hypothetical protein [candidate division TA06 bacterium]
MKRTILTMAVILIIAALAYAVPQWCEGHAKSTRGAYLKGWTISCPTYGSGIADTLGRFVFGYPNYPPAGYYYFHADSTGKQTLTSQDALYYPGTGQVDYGDIIFDKF